MTGPGLVPGARGRVAFVWEGRAGEPEPGCERGEGGACNEGDKLPRAK